MSDASRVAVYIDFDNVVISRYDSVHGEGAWRKDLARDHRRSIDSADPIDVKLAEAEVDLGAIIDYAASFGTGRVHPRVRGLVGARERGVPDPLVNWSVDLVQLFPASGTKNGADIRLAVDAVEDLGRHPEVSHLVFVAGDSDYVPLAQRGKRMGRYVVGIGVAGSTSGALVSACNEFIDYAELPGVIAAAQEGGAGREAASRPRRRARRARPRRTAGQEGHREEGDREEGRRHRVAGPGRCDRPAGARRTRRPAEERRRVGVRRRRQEPDAAHERRLQREVIGLLDVPRVRGVPGGRGGVQGRRQRSADGAAALAAVRRVAGSPGRTRVRRLASRMCFDG